MIDFAKLNLFSGEEHTPFIWKEGKPAILLVHGFLGTPAETRPLAHELHHSGWTVQSILLPGFGTDIHSLQERTYHEWVTTVQNAYRLLSLNHAPVIVAGHSLGSAIALNVAAREQPEGLILLAPFWRLGKPWHYWIWQLIKRVFWRGVRPLRKANFSDPKLIHEMSKFMPDLDLSDPDVQQQLRQFRMSPHPFDQLIQVGRQAYKHLPTIQTPTLIIQGTEDTVVPSQNTKQLVAKFNAPVQYIEVTATHDLLNKQADWWPAVARAVIYYAQQLLEKSYEPY